MKKYFIIFSLLGILFGCNIEETINSLNELNHCETKDKIKEETIQLINEARSVSRQCGSEYFYPAPPITWSDKLQQAAREHSDDMANNNFFDHAGSNGSNPGSRIYAQDYNWITYGENIFAGAASSQEAIEGWLKSADHCTNIMTPEFKEMGVACSRNTETQYITYWTQVFAVSY